MHFEITAPHEISQEISIKIGNFYPYFVQLFPMSHWEMDGRLGRIPGDLLGLPEKWQV